MLWGYGKVPHHGPSLRVCRYILENEFAEIVADAVVGLLLMFKFCQSIVD